jgi:predicted TIM-barrel fold metal-dependent hydrolase
MVFLSDAPLGPLATTIEGVKNLELEKAQLEAVHHGNAEKLLRMSIT